MSIRIRQDNPPPVSVTLPYKLYYSPYTDIPDFSIRDIQSSTHVFRDIVGVKDRSFKPCSNYQSETTVVGYKSVTWRNIQGTFLHPNHYGSVIDVTSNMKTAVISLDAQSLALAKALEDIQPSIDTYIDKVNLYAIVLELAEVALLVPRILGLLNKSASLLDKGVDAYITHSFGVMPMFGDIERIAGIFRKLGDAIDLWNDFAHTNRTMDFHRTVYDVCEGTETIVWSRGPDVRMEQGGLAKGYVKSISKLHLYIKPHIISDSQRTDAFLKSFGLDKPFTGIWEAVPFSWAIDYFTNIGDIIENLDFDIANMFTFDFVDSGMSVHDVVEYSYESKLTYWKNTNYTQYNESVLRSTKTNTFVREPLSEVLFREALVASPLSFEMKSDLTTRQTSYLVSVGRILTRKG